MLSDYEPGSLEHSEIEKRLKALRREQGNTIDAGKGIIVDPFPDHWVKFQKQNSELDEEIRKFENRLLADKRPLFFIHLYAHYKRKFVKEVENFDGFLKMKYGISLLSFIGMKKTDEQIGELENYRRFSFFIDNDSVMNRLSRYLQSKIKEIRLKTNDLYYDWSFVGPRENFLWVEKFYKSYNSQKQVIKDSDEFSSIEHYADFLRQQILSENSCLSDAAKDALWYCYVYKKSSNKEFVWKVFGDEIVDMLLDLNDRFVNFPEKRMGGKIEYLWNNYEIKSTKI